MAFDGWMLRFLAIPDGRDACICTTMDSIDRASFEFRFIGAENARVEIAMHCSED